MIIQAIRYLVVCLISAAAATSYAYYLHKNHNDQSSKQSQEATVERNQIKFKPLFQPLPPVIANLRFPSDKWIRLDVSIAVEPEAMELFNKLRDKLSEDILAHIRTIALPELEGDFGLIYLRTDLTERLQMRSGNKLKELAITSMVLQ